MCSTNMLLENKGAVLFYLGVCQIQQLTFPEDKKQTYKHTLKVKSAKKQNKTYNIIVPFSLCGVFGYIFK